MTTAFVGHDVNVWQGMEVQQQGEKEFIKRFRPRHHHPEIGKEIPQYDNEGAIEALLVVMEVGEDYVLYQLIRDKE